MNYIVLDMEWNQPFKMKRMIRNPIMLHGEIIQIGAVKLDENYHITDTFKIMVTPMFYIKMNNKVEKLTKITTADLQYGFPFEVAFRHFRKWCGEEFVFLTWGQNDVDMLRDNMILHNINIEWLPKTYNIQVIFEKQIAHENRQVSLAYAMERIGESVFREHDALSDARNTACICQHLDMVKGLAEYDKMKDGFGWQAFSKERSQDIKTYSSREEALNDSELIRFYSPANNTNVVCVDFVRQNSNKFMCIGKCDNGDELFVKFRFVKWPDGKFSVTRVLYEMDEYNKNYYMDKKKKREEAEAAYLQRIGSMTDTVSE